MNVKELYESIQSNMWETWEIVDNSRIRESQAEKQTRDYPGSAYSAEINGKFTITVHRNKLGKLSDSDWGELSQYISRRTSEIYDDEDFQGVYGDSIKAFIKYYNKNIDGIDEIVEEFSEDEFAELDFFYDNSKWIINIYYI